MKMNAESNDSQLTIEGKVLSVTRRIAQDHPEIWDEDRTRYAPLLLLSADSFSPDRLFGSPASLDWRVGVPSPKGSYLYTNRILPEWKPLRLALSPSKEGVVRFDGDVVIPTLFDLTGGYPDPWMSTTPQEIITQRPGLQRAHGTVVVGGLGLGWFLKKVHDKPEVERVILVEYSRELLDWYGYDSCGRLPKVTTRSDDLAQRPSTCSTSGRITANASWTKNSSAVGDSSGTSGVGGRRWPSRGGRLGLIFGLQVAGQVPDPLHKSSGRNGPTGDNRKRPVVHTLDAIGELTPSRFGQLA